MGESWRRKTYYRPRVMLDTARVLSPQFDGILVCLNGSEVEMLRNMTQYLRRRSTYASEYTEEYYLAPSESEWDDILAIVAELEEKLMGCEEIATALNSIAAQLGCICYALNSQAVLGQPQDEGYEDQPYYDDYSSPVVEGVGSPPGGLATWDDWSDARCIGSQKLVDDVRASVLDIGNKLTGGILLTFSILNGILVLTVISIPVSIVMQIITTIVAVGANIVYDDVGDWLEEHKQAIVCSIFTATTSGAAYQAVQAYIQAEYDLSAGLELVQSLFPHSSIADIFDHTQRGYADWSSSYSESYCDSCEEIESGVEFIWTWPPCPATHHTDGGTCDDGRLCFNKDVDDAHQAHIVSAGTYNQLTIEMRWRSSLPSGWTVGGVYCEWYDAGAEEWDHVAHLSADNDQAIGALNTAIEVFPLAIPQAGGMTRTRVHGQPGQAGGPPYPIQVEYVRMKYETV